MPYETLANTRSGRAAWPRSPPQVSSTGTTGAAAPGFSSGVPVPCAHGLSGPEPPSRPSPASSPCCDGCWYSTGRPSVRHRVRPTPRGGGMARSARLPSWTPMAVRLVADVALAGVLVLLRRQPCGVGAPGTRPPPLPTYDRSAAARRRRIRSFTGIHQQEAARSVASSDRCRSAVMMDIPSSSARPTKAAP